MPRFWQSASYVFSGLRWPGDCLYQTTNAVVDVAETGQLNHRNRPLSIRRPPLDNQEDAMSNHVAISPEEAADRLAIRELVEAYAHCADRRDAKGQMALFTQDTHFVVYMDAKDPKPTQELHSREA